LTKPILIVATMLLTTLQAYGQNSDVAFFVIGKHGNYTQNPTGDRTSVDYSFFSEIFLTADGDASDATLRFPTGELKSFKDMREVEGGARDNIFLVAGEDRFTDYTTLQSRYPDGEYRVTFRTPGGSVEEEVLRFEARDLPTPPRVTLTQGTRVGVHAPLAGEDVFVRWSAFSEGRSDPHGILDDLIFVILTNENDERVAHSGRPFEGRPYLTFADSSFTIDGNVLGPGHTYTLSVEHALLDDTIHVNGIPAFTTRAVTTKLTFTTAIPE